MDEHRSTTADSSLAQGPDALTISRRGFLRSAAAVSAGFGGLGLLAGRTHGLSRVLPSDIVPGFGPLVKDTAGILDLPAGFTYRIISRAGSVMADGLLVPGRADGMAAFEAPGGKTVIVRNHEVHPSQTDDSPFGTDNALLDRLPDGKLWDRGHGKTPGIGGTTNLLFDTRSQTLEREWLSLVGTSRNCAGGSTPWGTWLTCEEDVTKAGPMCEKDHGYVFEVPATDQIGAVDPEPLLAMGRFNHEACAVDPRSGCVYQSEDRDDGLFYRFVPKIPGKLREGGRLQFMRVVGRGGADLRNWSEPGQYTPGRRLTVEWVDIGGVDSPNDDLRIRGHADGGALFARMEGLWFGRGAAFIACTTGGSERKGQVWKYVPSAVEGTDAEVRSPGTIELFIEPNDGNIVDNCDNLTVAPWGDLVLCEDGWGTQNLLGVTPKGEVYRLGTNTVSNSEFAGACFSPDGSTMFVNIQKDGLTLAITGPWPRRSGHPMGTVR